MFELFDCETLIAQVEKRPGLHDFQLEEYNDKNIKLKLWTEACENVVTERSNLSPGETNEKGNTIYFIERKTLFISKFYVTPACLSVFVCLFICMLVCMHVLVYMCVFVSMCVCVNVCVCI
ncbi:hypothetical protein E2C01_054627 [Portunus trituberculatus]|uniref:Uncharacterized protein n=1 Tax=Portunus trituberculatus TaxID=210409 RepID=A0A5B7GT68_PORTR|nr:hypothetical protein [Portunus trituberculatus]